MILEGKIDGFLKGSIETIGKVPVINELNVSENGTYTAPSGIDGYNPVIVNVPKTPLSKLTVTENGTYTAPAGTGYDEVAVDVTKTPLSKLTVTENGTYTAPAGTGYDEVAVDVPLPSNAYLLKEVEGLPKDIATFSDGSNLPMPKLQVAIEPIQEGSGDPSPTNIRPIIGWDEVNVTRCGKNLVEDVISGWYITANGTFNVGHNYDMQIARVMKGQTYTVTSNEGLVAGFFVKKPTSSSTSYNGSRVDTSNKTFIAPIDGYVAFRTEHNYATSQCELGSTPTAYEPYNGQTYTIDLDGTRYGGTLDVVSGVLTLTDGFIPSYNGETLSSTWISDRDVYAEGTTPTIGAEVCYELATPQTIQLTPTQVKSLLGNNNVWADTGSINNIEYFAK